MTVLAEPIAREVSDPFIERGWQSPVFALSVYDKAFVHQGWLGGYLSLSATVRHNDVSTLDVVLAADHPRVPDLMTEGARLVVNYDGQLLMSGRIEARDGTLGPTPTVMFHLVSDFQFLNEVLAWPNPAGSMDEQGNIYKHYRRKGTAENVVKDLVQVNAVDRLGMPITVAPPPNGWPALQQVVVNTSGSIADSWVPGDGSRGGFMFVKARMETLFDLLVAKADHAGIGIKVYQSGPGIRVDVYVPTVRTRVLSYDSGVLVDGSWSQTDPTATHVVMAGGGEGTVREFRNYGDRDRTLLYGVIKERYVEARDLGDDYENAIQDVVDKLADLREARTNDVSEATPASEAAKVAAQTAYDTAVTLRNTLRVQASTDYADAALEALAEAHELYGISVTLAETEAFRYGKTFLVGDTITVQVAAGVSVTDVCREVTITDTADKGVEVFPSVGDPDNADGPNRSQRIIVRAVRRLLRDMRHQKAER